MLKLDLAGSSEEKLAREVAEQCSSLGAVGRVTVYPARSGAPARAFAIVSMATRDEAETVADSLGGRTVGNAVIVFLEQPAGPELPLSFPLLPAAPPRATLRSTISAASNAILGEPT